MAGDNPIPEVAICPSARIIRDLRQTFATLRREDLPKAPLENIKRIYSWDLHALVQQADGLLLELSELMPNLNEVERVKFALNYIRLPLGIDPSIHNDDLAKMLPALDEAFKRFGIT